jgi:hypothetical protein
MSVLKAWISKHHVVFIMLHEYAGMPMPGFTSPPGAVGNWFGKLHDVRDYSDVKVYPLGSVPALDEEHAKRIFYESARTLLVGETALPFDELSWEPTGSG